MEQKLSTQAELLAQKAENLPAFSGVKLLHIKRQLSELLNLIGRNRLFDEYTKHDISHIDEMLKMLDWLIPENTKTIMSPADWLMVVLAIYFHDVGMLVNNDEYKRRESSGFPEYRENVLFKDDNGTDYKSRISELDPEDAERFLYQEFVRHKHAERASNWITGHASDHIGVSHSIIGEIDQILMPLGAQFRRDLALVCESHHLDDLNDFRKYKCSQPYGNSDSETVNLQYVAILLRTADLLHITRDRTPSIVFKLINPTDPVSQTEWAKQMAVTRVRPKLGKNRDGIPDENASKDTIEVYAFFRDPNGFFGLTSYLIYAQEQIRKSHEWVSAATRNQGVQHSFPWRYIDDSNIETEGFLKNTFEFTIDQAKILDLLTGHTLYNDTSVVLREIAQNSLDAIRLQKLIDKEENIAGKPGRVDIRWDSKQRLLSVSDNGTGMTQDIIERHLLRVGSSRYQDVDFIRRYPDFSGISRFGIGLLSTFMIADNVEITTCHPDDGQARQLSLRSVHGRYLIRLLEKDDDLIVKSLLPHGTLVKLRVRPSANLEDIIDIAQRWIVIPNCEVFAYLDEQEPIRIGFDSPKDALTDTLAKLKIPVDQDLPSYPYRVSVVERQMGDVTLAYAITWSRYFQEWSFYSFPAEYKRDDKSASLGICIEGVRITFDTPGFTSKHIVAIANAQGPHAPKTNVARSGLELTSERDSMLGAVYTLYCDHIKSEINALTEKYHFSLTWAVQEARYLLSSLTTSKDLTFRLGGGNSNIDNKEVLIESIKNLPIILVERKGKRENVSIAELDQEDSFWTIDSAFFRFAEMLIREAPGASSLSSLGKAFEDERMRLPDGIFLCYSGYDHEIVDENIFLHREVNVIRLMPGQRRIDLRWDNRKEKARWIDMPDWFIPINVDELAKGQLSGSESVIPKRVRIGLEDSAIEILGQSDELAIRAFGTLYLLPGHEVSKFMQKLLTGAERNLEAHKNDRREFEIVYSMAISILLVSIKTQTLSADENIRNAIINLAAIAKGRYHINIEDCIDMREFDDLLNKTHGSIFDTSAWERDNDSHLQ